MTDKTVIVKIYGGLGNQMFQYASGLGLANALNMKLALDLSPFENYKLWDYELKEFSVPQNIWPHSTNLSPTSSTKMGRLLKKLKITVPSPHNFYIEPHFHFDDQFFELNGDQIFIDGYFQSPLYFNNVKDELLKQFLPRQQLSQTAQNFEKKITKSKTAISIHVRRGDYVNNPSAALVHKSQSIEYYQRSVQLLQDLLKTEIDFYLFSDEPDRAAKDLEGLGNFTVVKTDPKRSWEDMILMSKCSHHIIANSSYSWWGAWLNTNSSKKVIAPAEWFTPSILAKTNVIDLYPENWILLK